jgi:hypothetical protein
MERDITGYWSNLGEQIRPSWARCMGIRLLRLLRPYRERDQHAAELRYSAFPCPLAREQISEAGRAFLGDLQELSPEFLYLTSWGRFGFRLGMDSPNQS